MKKVIEFFKNLFGCKKQEPEQEKVWYPEEPKNETVKQIEEIKPVVKKKKRGRPRKKQVKKEV